jgi:hypothetical protein
MKTIADAQARRALFDKCKAVLTAAGELEGQDKRRLDEIEGLFEIGARAQ